MSYAQNYVESLEAPETFWSNQAQALKWDVFPQKILNATPDGYYNWFEDGMLNISYLCIDKHIEDGYGAHTAIVYDSPVTQSKTSISFNKLLEEVSKLASGLQTLGLQKGDTAVIYMPMIPQAIYAMLACARIGVTHSVVFGGFAPNELAIRIDDCKPKVIITASNGIEITKHIPYKPYVDKAITQATYKPKHVVVYDRELGVEIPQKPYDIDYANLVAQSQAVKPISLPSTHPLYILYTSGTTGTPKGVIRDTGGYATALKYSMQAVYGVQSGDVFWAASDVGWVVGHSYIVYGPLLNRNTTILFEGKPIKTPDASTFWRVIAEHQVNVMFTAPTAIRAIKKEDPNCKLLKPFDLSCLRYQFLAGERCDIATLSWLETHLNVPVIDHWWQTESGWPMLASMMGYGKHTIKPGAAGQAVCGYQIDILDDGGQKAAPNTEGFVAVKLPLPPGTLSGLWGNPERFKKGYLEKFPGYYFSGDGGYKDDDGYVFITGRVDDVINVAGHRLSTSEMEEVVASHPAVAECAVFGIKCPLKGQKPLGLMVLKSGEQNHIEQLQKDIIASVRTQIGAVASFKQVLVVERLPKTRSGKILRKLLRQIADGNTFKIPSTIDDPQIITEIKNVYIQNQIL